MATFSQRLASLGFMLAFLTVLGNAATDPQPEADTDLPDLEQIFSLMDRSAFAELLSPSISVNVDTRPLLRDHGSLTRHQTLLAFRKLIDRFRVTEIQIINSQSDTNYSWLEIYLNLTLKERRSGQVYRVTFALNFKIASSRMALNRWVLQDIR